MANLRRQNGREKPWRVRCFGIGNEFSDCRLTDAGFGAKLPAKAVVVLELQ